MKRFIVPFMLLTGSIASCRSESGAPEAKNGEVHEAAAPTNRVDIPAPVRSNLGITFAKVEKRDVANTLRVPGRFELLPSARREHRTPLTGRVDVLVKQYQAVVTGDALYRLDSPQWRDLQRELADATSAVDISKARLASFGPVMEGHRLHEQGLREAVELWSNRVQRLEEVIEAGGGGAAELADARASLTEAQASFGEVMEKLAELQLRHAEIESEMRSAWTRRDLLESTAAALLGVTREPREPSTDEVDAAAPFWQTVAQIEIRAAMDGVVESLPLTNGAWADVGELVLTVVDPAQVRFHAIALQSDLARLRSGLSAAIVAPGDAGLAEGGAIPATLEIGLNADAEQRTIELLASPSRAEAWVRPGVSAFLEIATERTPSPELAVPMSAVVHDGLISIIFRRDPANPDRAIRIEADLGLNDGRWIVVNSGVKEGDEVVLDGVYQLLLATASSATKGGHFHADGTFHAGDDE